MSESQTLNDACRLCDENKEQMYSIFSKTRGGQQIIHLIQECLPLVVSSFISVTIHELLNLKRCRFFEPTLYPSKSVKYVLGSWKVIVSLERLV